MPLQSDLVAHPVSMIPIELGLVCKYLWIYLFITTWMNPAYGLVVNRSVSSPMDEIFLYLSSVTVIRVVNV